MCIQVSPCFSGMTSPAESVNRYISDVPPRVHVPSKRLPPRRITTAPVPVERKSTDGAPVTSAVPGISFTSVLMTTTLSGITSFFASASMVVAPPCDRWYDPDAASKVYVTLPAPVYGMASDVASLPTALPTRASNCSAGTSTRARPASPAASRILLPEVYALYGATLPASGRLWIASPSGAEVPRRGHQLATLAADAATSPAPPDGPPPHAPSSRVNAMRIARMVERVQPLCREESARVRRAPACALRPGSSR